MTYKYYTFNPNLNITASSILVNEFQSLLNDRFNVATDVFTILEEPVIGSGIYENITVRITGAISSLTGDKLSDDYKQILFQQIDHNSELGKKYFFDNNWWLCIYTEGLKALTANCVVRRCNNTFRWVDENGNLYSEYCCLEYKINRPKETLGASDPISIEGYTDAFLQLNANTKLIHGNQRFLVGPASNRICLKSFGNGVRSYMNQSTIDDESGQLLMLSLGGATVDLDTDDLVNGIADGLKYKFSLSVNPSSITGNAGTTIQLNPTLTLNGNSSNQPLTYTSDGSSVATVSASGLVTLVSSGSCNIYTAMSNNSTVYTTIPASVVILPINNSEVVITPTPSIIYEGNSQTYNINLYINGIQQANTFIYATADNNVPITNYLLTKGNNSLTINNIKNYMNYPLNINAISGSYTGLISVQLRGPF